jgi:hypothetical protein
MLYHGIWLKDMGVYQAQIRLHAGTSASKITL